MSVYLATLVVLAWSGLVTGQWLGLASVCAATAFICLLDRRPIGFVAAPRIVTGDFLRGVVFAVVLLGVADLLIVATSDLRHGLGDGFPWRELLVVFIPAVLHEELLFRGYAFQRLLAANRSFAIVFVALVFAAVHAGNRGVTMLALANIFLGGILLGLAFDRTRRLWFPIGIHLGWNLMSGPILGHEVSGYIPLQTVLTTLGGGPAWLTGAEFGIEGSALLTAVELASIAWLNIIPPARVEAHRTQ